MLPDHLRNRLAALIAQAEHPRETVIDVMFALQGHYGYMNEEAMQVASELLDMTPLELDELATFYDFIYREPVGKNVIHVCDSAVCWMFGHQSVIDYISGKLGITAGETTPDGLFTLLPVCCIGYCDRAPAMLVNRKVFGHLTPEKIDRILAKAREDALAAQGG